VVIASKAKQSGLHCGFRDRFRERPAAVKPANRCRSALPDPGKKQEDRCYLILTVILSETTGGSNG
jgi:hypothetical protein